jgi:hypothetical protein
LQPQAGAQMERPYNETSFRCTVACLILIDAVHWCGIAASLILIDFAVTVGAAREPPAGATRPYGVGVVAGVLAQGGPEAVQVICAHTVENRLACQIGVSA